MKIEINVPYTREQLEKAYITSMGDSLIRKPTLTDLRIWMAGMVTDTVSEFMWDDFDDAHVRDLDYGDQLD